MRAKAEDVAAAEARADAAAKRAMWLGGLGAGFMIAFQIAGKATRDAFYLTHHDVSTLPGMIATAAVVSILAVLGASGLILRVGPRRAVPALFLLSAAALLGEWQLAERSPAPAAVIVYLHLAVFGSILISTFWSLANECFDPRRAKQGLGRIAAAGTVGGLAGGLIAGLAGAEVPLAAMLPILAVLHTVCAGVSLGLRPLPGAHDEELEAPRPWTEAVNAFRRLSLLRVLGSVVFLATLGATLLDLVFKGQAAARYTQSDELIRFFAVFYGGVSLFTVVVQSAFGRRAVEHLGPARTMAVLPATAGVGALGALIVPGLAMAVVARAGEAVLRSSVHRSGYEVLFTPVSPRDKRSTKTWIDVAFDRLGDAAGGGLAYLFVLLFGGALAARAPLLVVSVLAFAAALYLVPRLRRGFRHALASSLHKQAERLDIKPTGTAGESDASVLQSLSGLDLSVVLQAVRRNDPGLAEPSLEPPPESGPPEPRDPVAAAVAALRSRDPVRVRQVLASPPAPAAEIASQVIPLLAWNEIAPDAARFLKRAAPRIQGRLLDHLLDSDEDFAVRRRIPRLMSRCGTDLAALGLRRALGDRRFEVRYQTGLALARLHESFPNLRPDREEITAAVVRELQVDRRVWESYRLIDALENDEQSGFIDEAVRDRASRSLEHVFTLLSLILPKDPLRIAFRGLHTTDPSLRATALEYLDMVLPRKVRDGLWPFLDAQAAPAEPQEARRSEVLQQLLDSNVSIQVNLEELRRQAGFGKPTGGE